MAVSERRNSESCFSSSCYVLDRLISTPVVTLPERNVELMGRIHAYKLMLMLSKYVRNLSICNRINNRRISFICKYKDLLCFMNTIQCRNLPITGQICRRLDQRFPNFFPIFDACTTKYDHAPRLKFLGWTEMFICDQVTFSSSFSLQPP